MSTLISSITNTKLKLRWEEPYVSLALNKQYASRESGVLFGFMPTPSGGLSIDLEPNSSTGTSAVAVRDTSLGISVLYVEDATVTLDLTAFAGTKVWIGVAISYATGVATSGQIRAYTLSEVEAGLGDVDVLLAVDVPGSGNIEASHFDFSERSFWWMERMESDDFAMQNVHLNNSLPLDTLLYVGGKSPDTSGADIDVTLEPVTGGICPQSLRFQRRAGTNSEARTLVIVRASETDFVLARWRAKYASATATEVGLQVRWLAADLSYISTTKSIEALTAATEDWAVHKATFMGVSGAAFAEVQIVITSMSAGNIYFEQFFVTTPHSGGYHDAAPALGVQSYLVVGVQSLADAADIGLLRFDSSGYFGIEAISSVAQVKGDTGVSISAVVGGVSVNFTTSMTIAGGYGSSGVTITAGGALSMDGALIVGSGAAVVGSLTVGGGYGSSGVTLSSDGNVSMDGQLIVGGPADVGGALTVTGNIIRSSKGTFRFGGGYAIAQVGMTSIGADWAPEETKIVSDVTGSAYLRIPLATLPTGAAITSVGVTALCGATSPGASLTVRLKKAVGLTVTTVSSDTTSGATSGATKSLTIANTDGGSGDEEKASVAAYYIEIEADGDGTLGVWEVYLIYANWETGTLNVQNY